MRRYGWGLAAAGGMAVLFLAWGPRAAIPHLMPPYLTLTGLDRESFNLMLTVQSLVWGLSQPVFGHLADRGHGRRVLVLAALLHAAGLLLMPFSGAAWLLHLTGGVLMGLGLGAAGFATVFSLLARRGGGRPGTGFAAVTAAAASAALVFTPLTQALVVGPGIFAAFLALGAAMLLIAPAAVPLAPTERRTAEGTRLAACLGHPVFRALLIAALAGGFQCGLVSAYFGVTLADSGLAVGHAVVAVALLHLCNVAGAALSGPALARLSAPGLIGGLFLLRSAAFAALLLLPMGPALAFGFALLAGLTWLAALPLSASWLLQACGARHLGLLTGLLLLGWQAGTLAAIAFGFETYGWNGHYGKAWQISLGLGLLAAFLCLSLRQRSYQRA